MKKLHTITANNVSTNGKMAQELLKIVPHFKTKTHVLGCVSHVINLGEKSGLGVLGSIEDKVGQEISMLESDSASNVMSILSLTSDPDGIGLNLQTILKGVHGLCT